MYRMFLCNYHKYPADQFQQFGDTVELDMDYLMSH